MPELAEVETLMRYLKKNILNEQIVHFQKNRNNLRYNLSETISSMVQNSYIEDVQRRAKFLNIKLSNNNSMVIHLGMSGRLIVKDQNYIQKKHDHVRIDFASGNCLIFNDVRRFGMIYACPSSKFDQQIFLKNMGVEPLTDNFNTDYLIDKIRDKSIPIKNLLMNSKIVVGVGNIYAAESLFEAGISPDRKVSSITKIEAQKIVKAVKFILDKAIKAGGTTLKDFVSGDDKPGYFKQELKVYARDGMKCFQCPGVIKKIKQAGRSSFFCKYCQK